VLYASVDVDPVVVMRYPIGDVSKNEQDEPTGLHDPVTRYCQPPPTPTPVETLEGESEKCTSIMNGDALGDWPQPVVRSNCKKLFEVVVFTVWDSIF